MSRTGARNAIALVIMTAGFVAAPCRTAAQDPPDELTPRAIADSTYGVRIAVDALLEGIRRGQLDLRRFNDAQLGAAVGKLAATASSRARRPPHADVGVLWDLQMDVAEFEPEGPDVLRARTHVFLATARDSATAPVILAFRRRGDRWDLAAHEGLAARLIAIATSLETRGRP